MDEQALNEKYPGRMVYREGDRIIVKIPVRFRRRNGRQMIFAAGEGAASNSKSEDNALAWAIARAWKWQEELESGEYLTIEELASAKRSTSSERVECSASIRWLLILSRRFCRTTHLIISVSELSTAGSR